MRLMRHSPIRVGAGSSASKTKIDSLTTVNALAKLKTLTRFQIIQGLASNVFNERFISVMMFQLFQPNVAHEPDIARHCLHMSNAQRLQ